MTDHITPLLVTASKAAFDECMSSKLLEVNYGESQKQILEEIEVLRQGAKSAPDFVATA